MSGPKSSSLLPGIGYGLMATALWGGVFLAPKFLPDCPPLLLSAGRYLIYGLVSIVGLIPVWKGIQRRITRRDVWTLIWLGLAGNLVYYACVAVAVIHVGVVPVSVLIGLLPVTITLCGGKGRGTVPLSRLAWPLACIIAGMACINIDLFLMSPPDTHSVWEKMMGIGAAFGALACWTAYGVGNARYLAVTPKWTSHEWSLLGGVSTGILALAFVWPAWASLPPGHYDWTRFGIVILTLGVGASVVTNSLWNAASRRLPLTFLGKLLVFETLFALGYSFCYDHRWPRIFEVAAIVLMMVGVGWSAYQHNRPQVKIAL